MQRSGDLAGDATCVVEQSGPKIPRYGLLASQLVLQSWNVRQCTSDGARLTQMDKFIYLLCEAADYYYKKLIPAVTRSVFRLTLLL